MVQDQIKIDTREGEFEGVVINLPPLDPRCYLVTGRTCTPSQRGPLVPQGGPRTTKIPSDLRGVEIGSMRQAFGAGAAQPQHLLPEGPHVLPSFICPGAAANLPAVMSRLRRAAANYTPDLQIGCSPIRCCAHARPTYVPVRP